MSAAWLTRSLGEVVAITKGRKPHRLIADSSGGSLPYATADYFRSDIATQFVPSADLASCVLTKKGYPVLIWDGSNAGEVFVGKDAVLASTMALIRPDDSVLDEGFCYFFLKTAFDKLNDGTTGSTIPHVSKHMLTALQIPILPLSEQRLISSLLFKLESAIAVQAQLTDATVELKRAAMRDLFTRGLRGEPQKETEIGPVPESWNVVSLGSLGRIGNGSTPKKSVHDYWEGGTFPWLTSAKVYDRDIEAADQFVTKTALDECHLPIVKPGAVLIAITGQGKTLGHCAVLRVEATINQHVAYLQTDISKADPGFIRGYLETQYDSLRQVAAGGGSTKGALTCSFLRSLSLPLPEMAEQREIVAILDAIDRKIDLHRKKRAVLEELFKALLHKLMTGVIRVDELDLSSLTDAPARHKEAVA
jgi:type I restriction enzyme S subunit